jgi:hypothetical protein
MNTVVQTWRFWLARYWRSYIAASITIGLCFGLAFFALAGARRTQSAYPRFLDHVRTSTLSISTEENYVEATNAEIAAIPGVARSRTYVSFNINVLVNDKPDPSQAFETIGTFDGRYFDQDRFTATDGRTADPQRDDEVVVNEFGADRLGYKVGQTLELGIYSIEQLQDPAFFDKAPPPFKRIKATVVGIGVFPDEIVQDEADRTARFLITPALSREVRAIGTFGLQGLMVSGGDAGVQAVLAQLAKIVPIAKVEVKASDDIANAHTAISPLSLVLGVFGSIAAVVGILLSCQALSGATRATRDDLRLFVVFGTTRGGAVVLSLMTAVCGIAAGVIGAIAVAIVASPAMPIGPVRRVEAAPGIDVDATVLAVGGIAVGLVLVAWSSIAALREIRGGVAHRATAGELSRAPLTSASVARLRPEAATGVRFALSGGRRIPARTAIVSAMTATTALVAAVSFATSLDRMVRTPATFGWNADAAVLSSNGYGNLDEDRVRAILGTDPAVEDWSGVYFGADKIDDIDVPLMGMQSDSTVLPPLLSGRFINGDDEIVLGPRTAAALGAKIGDRLVLDGTGSPRKVTVVGTAVLPTIGKIHSQRTSLGRGAIVTPTLVPGSDLNIFGEPAGRLLGPNGLFVRYADGVSADDELTHLRETTAPLTGFAGLDVLPVQRPAEIVSSGDIGAAPMMLAVALAIGAMVSLLIALSLSVRGRRKELAVLSALGFTRRQRAATLMWHSTVVVVIGLIVGLPLGAIVGRELWRAFAGRIDVVAQPVTAWSASALIAVIALVLANLVALAPARSASRLDVASALRDQ